MKLRTVPAIIFILLFLKHHIPLVDASIVLNEISPRTSPEWLELYNSGTDPIDLNNWYLKDAAGNKKPIAVTEPLSPNNYFLATGYSSWLNNTGTESVYLYDSADVLVDSVSFAETKEGTVIARIPDITGTWLLDQVSSPLASNDSVLPSPIPSPSPTPSPSPSPSPLPTPAAVAATPSPTTTPTPTPTPTPVLISTPKPSPTPTPLPSPSSDLLASPEGTVAAAVDVDLSSYGISPRPTSSPTPALLQLNHSRLRFLSLTLGGLILFALATFLGYQQYKHSQKTPTP